MLFQNLFRVTGQLVQFHHIHGSGFQGVLGDMCGKQAHGMPLFIFWLQTSCLLV